MFINLLVTIPPPTRVVWQNHVMSNSKTERQTNKQTNALHCRMYNVMWVGQQAGSQRLQCAADRPVQYCNITADTLQFTQKLKKTVNKQNRPDSVWARRTVSSTRTVTFHGQPVSWQRRQSHAVVLPGRRRHWSVYLTTLATTKTIQRGCTWTKQ